jgi:hypothetical protein
VVPLIAPFWSGVNSKIALDTQPDILHTARVTQLNKPKKREPEKLTKADPEFYSKIAKLAGQKLARKKGTDYFSKLAKKSHPRAEYHGGRPKKQP